MKDFKPKVFRNVVVFHGLCKGCGMCVEKCPQKAITFSKKDLGVYSTPSIEVEINKCNVCGICETVCPDSAIRVEKLKNV